jgi:hypothetical protein
MMGGVEGTLTLTTTSVYQKAGKISNDDMLYTLSLFVLETSRWIRTYEWRAMTPMEVCAMCVNNPAFLRGPTSLLLEQFLDR